MRDEHKWLCLRVAQGRDHQVLGALLLHGMAEAVSPKITVWSHVAKHNRKKLGRSRVRKMLHAIPGYVLVRPNDRSVPNIDNIKHALGFLEIADNSWIPEEQVNTFLYICEQSGKDQIDSPDGDLKVDPRSFLGKQVSFLLGTRTMSGLAHEIRNGKVNVYVGTSKVEVDAKGLLLAT